MKERISTLMDGELDDRAAGELIAALARDEAAATTWRAYHTIGDAMRGTAPLSDGFAARVAWKLTDEPTVLAPRRARPEPRTWFALSAAASVAAVALVGWLALAPQEIAPVPAPIAEAPRAAQSPVTAQVATVRPASVPLPSGTNDYLLAHQGFSPRLYLQGMAPYVRTVSDSREAGK